MTVSSAPAIYVKRPTPNLEHHKTALPAYYVNPPTRTNSPFVPCRPSSLVLGNLNLSTINTGYSILVYCITYFKYYAAIYSCTLVTSTSRSCF
jgi:hypothetical protein